jgi:hypothetical protein
VLLFSEFRNSKLIFSLNISLFVFLPKISKKFHSNNPK